MALMMLMTSLKDILKDLPGTIDAIKAGFMDIPGSLRGFMTYLQNNPLMALMIAYAIFNRIRKTFEPKKKEDTVKETKVIEILSDEDYSLKVAEAKKAGAIVVIDFYADWCPPCKKAAPVFGDLSMKLCSSKVLFWKVSTDKLPGVAKSCGIKSLPTFKIYKNGEEVDEMVGFQEAELTRRINKAVGDVLMDATSKEE